MESNTHLLSSRAREKAVAPQGSQPTAGPTRNCVIEGGDYNDWMFALRYAALAAIALWGGGMIVLGAVAAPSIFDTLAVRGVADHRAVGGAIFGEVLRRFDLLAYGCAGVLFVSLLLRAVLGPRPAYFGIRFAIFGLMLVSTLYSGVILSKRIETARAAAGGAPSALPDTDPRRAEFGRLHQLSTILHLIPVAGAFALLFWEARDPS